MATAMAAGNIIMTKITRGIMKMAEKWPAATGPTKKIGPATSAEWTQATTFMMISSTVPRMTTTTMIYIRRSQNMNQDDSLIHHHHQNNYDCPRFECG